MGVGHISLTSRKISPSAGLLLVYLNRVRQQGRDKTENANEVYLLLLWGYSWGESGVSVVVPLPYLPFEVYTPGIMGKAPGLLQGPAFFFSAAATVGKGDSQAPSWLRRHVTVPGTGVGLGYAALLMGMGYSIGPSFILGHDTGIDLLTGFCLRARN